MLNIRELIEKRQGENLRLHEHINPQFAKVLSTIGFDKVYGKSSGISIYGMDGHEYLDFLSGYGVFAIGRNHPQIKKTLQEFLDLDLTSKVQMEAPLLSGLLAEKLIGHFGHGIRERVFFTNSGTEAVEGAIKFARAATGRQKLLHLDHSFHGLSTGSLAINGNSEFRTGFGQLIENESIPVNDVVALEKALATDNFAAFIFEPVQGKGVYIPESSFIRTAAALCKKQGTILIADEIQTAFGRTGKWLACEHFGIEPDIITISKALSGGMIPVGAIIYTADIYKKVFSSLDRCVVHSSTFGQNNLAMVAGLTTLDIFENENLVERAEKMGHLFREKLLSLQEKYDWIKEIRSQGLLIGIEFGKPKGFKNRMAWEVFSVLQKGLFAQIIAIQLLQKHHILTQVSGHHQDIVRLIPPLIIEEKHIDKFISALDDVLAECGNISGPLLALTKNLAKQALK